VNSQQSNVSEQFRGISSNNNIQISTFANPNANSQGRNVPLTRIVSDQESNIEMEETEENTGFNDKDPVALFNAHSNQGNYQY
jgi:hypothetical protein